ncbi:hypothetical protein [Xenorhabdus cabanillasii]|uniref:hypothetical protein n=1 Tax=Xenorhabdus cabanillasii TaxID=351673 RepID=UPI000E23F580|nr:hypothetical protein [Xenorhabdus cabanillasii]
MGNSGFALAYVYLYDEDDRNKKNIYYRNAEERQKAEATGNYIPINHAVIIVWSGGELFIFDPNVGGGLFNYDSTEMKHSTIQISINLMYSNFYCKDRVSLVSVFRPEFDSKYKTTNKVLINNSLKNIYHFRNYN